MNYFLEETAKDIYKKHKNELSGLCLVFPNRRSGIFFRYYLGGILESPVWSPKITTIADLMQDFSGLKKADPLSMIFDLYEIYKKEKKTSEPFDEFYFWGEMLLHDFDDLDKYLIEPRDLFQNLASLKSIEDKFTYLTEEQINAIKRFWDTIDMNRLSGEQENFVSVWEILHNVYFQFNSQLDEKKWGYEGKIYRTVVDKIRANALEINAIKYIFIGFNALTPCEKKLFHYLKTNQKAEFYWDYDQYYLGSNEAGKFIKSNVKDFPGSDLNIYNNYDDPKDIQLINTSYDVAQGKILPELLDETQQSNQTPNKTAVVLPDEHLLLPVLNSIPDSFESVNVTMGYPVYLTPAYSLLLSLINLQQNIKRGEKEPRFYYKDVLAILNHQYLGIIRDDKTEAKMASIREHNKVYIPAKELKLGGVTEQIFQIPDNYQALSDYLLDNYYNFYRLLKERSDDKDKSLALELECIYNVYLAIKRLKEIFTNQKVEVKTETYLRIIERVIEAQSIAFQGEPLSGLQVMGILETRALDFENLVILSMNEGVFPKAESSSTFIPYHLRKGFGLPTYEYNDAIYAYYFYRIIQRAKKITLVYNSSTDGLQTGEMSRFMQQLKYESGFNIQEKTVVSDINLPETQPIQVDKTQQVLDILEKYNSVNEKGRTLSPSAFNTYLRCSLQFYYKYIAGIKEPEELNEDIDAPLFGLLFHKAVELIYMDYKEDNLEVTKSELEKLKQDKSLIENCIIMAFKEEYFTDEVGDNLDLSGKHVLIKDILHQYISHFLEVEKKYAPFVLIDLEREYYTNINFTVKGEEKKITFKGKIDRVDENEDGIRVIDYKSGQSKPGFKDLEGLFTPDGNHAALQALIYSRMYKEYSKTNKAVQPGLYFIRDLYNNFDYRIKMNRSSISYSDVNQELDKMLKTTLEELFNPDKPFTQVEDEKICRSCPYNSICRRG